MLWVLGLAADGHQLPVAKVAVGVRGRGPRRHAVVLDEVLQGAGLEAGKPSPGPFAGGVTKQLSSTEEGDEGAGGGRSQAGAGPRSCPAGG